LKALLPPFSKQEEEDLIKEEADSSEKIPPF
jgi:hypothetical protein